MIVILSILVVLALVDGLIHSRIVQNKALALFKESLQESGWDVDIKNIESTFPYLELEGLTLTAPDFVLAFGKLKANFSFLRLLKHEIVFKTLNADQVSWYLQKNTASTERTSSKHQKRFTLIIEEFSLTNATLFDDFVSTAKGSFSILENRARAMNFQAGAVFLPISENPFLAREWTLSSKFRRNNDGTWSFPKVQLSSNVAQIHGFGSLDSEGKIAQSAFEVKSNYLAKLFANIHITQDEKGVHLLTHWRIPTIEIQQQKMYNAHGEINAQVAAGTIEGTSLTSADYREIAWTAKTPFSWNKEDGFVFTNLEVSSPAIQAQGKLQIGKEGTINLDASFASNQIHDLFPRGYGMAIGKIEWNRSTIHLDTRINEAHFEDFSAKTLKIYSDIQDPFGAFTGNLVCDIEQGKWRNLLLEEASIETTKEGENWPFALSLLGRWEHPLQLDLSGFWSYKQETLLINLQNGEGSFFNHPLLLPSPAQFAMSPDVLRLKDFSLEIADASIQAAIQKNKDQGEASLKIKHLPIDFLSLNPLDVAIEGMFNLDLSITEKGDDVRGDLVANFENLEMSLLGWLDPLNAEGNIESHFSRERLDVRGELNVRDAPLATIDLSLPIHFAMRPLTTAILYDREVEGRFYLNGRLEEFLDFFNLGTHRLEGGCYCDFRITNTLEHPHLYGKCDFTNGYYQNYYTGTELQNIQAQITSQKGFITLRKLTATDAQNKGAFTATGKVDLLPLVHFPFAFDVNFSRLNVATFDLITTEANGALQITGNLERALATGNLDIVETDVTVPSRIPKTLPDLQVTYKNAVAPPFAFELPKEAPYPLHLDLFVNAPDGIFISGRGLESEWRGQFQVEGTQTDIATKGMIELIKGNFNFSGRSFALTEGSLTFSGVPNASPYLNLAGQIQIKDVLITAHLKGPLNNPQVTLQSSPPLPMGTIVAYLLFGQDLTEISSFQALQLAGSIASIAGDGPGILEQTKKSLGVDRIQIITVPSSTTESGETIAVQVGKYVAEGVLVSYSQGAENSAGNVSVEVEIQGNLSFILESEQADDQKQGKFTFRWARTY